MTDITHAEGDLARVERESAFWDHEIRPLHDYIKVYRKGPSADVQAMLDALEPLEGTRVLDFACGAGVLSAMLAARGAQVTGIDVAPAAVERARVLCDAVGVSAEFRCLDLAIANDQLGQFDRLAGQYALHHVDVAIFAPLLAAHVAPGGRGAFLETMSTNPLFWFGRKFVAGRFGIPQYGTEDERPIGRRELARLRSAFGDAELRIGQVTFLRLIDRQLFRYRRPAISRFAKRVDDRVAVLPSLHWLSYHRIVVVKRTAPSVGLEHGPRARN